MHYAGLLYLYWLLSVPRPLCQDKADAMPLTSSSPTTLPASFSSSSKPRSLTLQSALSAAQMTSFLSKQILSKIDSKIVKKRLYLRRNRIDHNQLLRKIYIIVSFVTGRKGAYRSHSGLSQAIAMPQDSCGCLQNRLIWDRSWLQADFSSHTARLLSLISFWHKITRPNQAVSWKQSRSCHLQTQPCPSVSGSLPQLLYQIQWTLCWLWLSFKCSFNICAICFHSMLQIEQRSYDWISTRRGTHMLCAEGSLHGHASELHAINTWIKKSSTTTLQVEQWGKFPALCGFQPPNHRFWY